MKTKIAGVSVSTETPPKREELLKLALEGKKYQNFNIPEATEAINKEIDKSGLYQSNTPKSPSKKEPSTGNPAKSNPKSVAKSKEADKGKVD